MDGRRIRPLLLPPRPRRNRYTPMSGGACGALFPDPDECPGTKKPQPPLFAGTGENTPTRLAYKMKREAGIQIIPLQVRDNLSRRSRPLPFS